MCFHRYISASHFLSLSFIGVFILPFAGCENKVSEQLEPVENQAVSDDYDPRITYCRDVAPILDQHCAVCHHHGGPGPFALVTYDDAKSRVEQLVDVTESRYMPPWLPDPTYSHFSGERWLSESDIDRTTACHSESFFAVAMDTSKYARMSFSFLVV